MQDSFSGEARANRKYKAFAKIADKEDYEGVAKLYRAAAAAEGIHAKNYMKLLGVLGTTKENLESSVEGEDYEFTTMYPKFIAAAKKEGNLDAAQKLEWAFKVEQKHYNYFKQDLAEIKQGKKPADVDYYVCKVCGNTLAQKPTGNCDVCGASKDQFFEVD